MFGQKSSDSMDSLESQIRETLLANKEKMVAQMYEAALASVRQSVTYKIEAELQTIFSEFIRDHIRPEFSRMLMEQREAMLSNLAEGIAGVGVEIGTKLQAKASESMGNSWTATEILRKIFGV